MQVHLPVYGLTDVLGEARRISDAGAAGAFTFEGPHDVFLPLGIVAAHTDLAVMTNVAIAFPRNAVHMAHAAWDLQLLSRGRFTLGLGTQVRTHIEQRFGVDFDRPVARMRDTVGALQAIFATWADGVPLDHRGPFRTHTRMSPVFTPPPLPDGTGPPPVMVGGLGPRMCEMAAEVADGLAVMPVTSERYFEQCTLPAVARGLARRTRSSTFEILPELIVCAGRDEHEIAVAEQGCRGLLGFYLSTPAYRAVFELEGYGEAQPVAQAVTREGRWDELGALIDETLLRRIAVWGTPAEVAEQISRRYRDHATRVAVYAPYEMAPGLLAEIVEALA